MIITRDQVNELPPGLYVVADSERVERMWDAALSQYYEGPTVAVARIDDQDYLPKAECVETARIREDGRRVIIVRAPDRGQFADLKVQQ